MACLDMNARISFSNDFADTQQCLKPNNYTEAPASSDFQFSAPFNPMMAADELFSNGKLVPLKENSRKILTTLKDELLFGEDGRFEDVGTTRSAKGLSRWKQKLGLNVHKKGGKNVDEGLERIDEMKGLEMAFEDGFGKFKGDKICIF